jgi:hypothetical protein
MDSMLGSSTLSPEKNQHAAPRRFVASAAKRTGATNVLAGRCTRVERCLRC